MTKGEAINKVLTLARSEVGLHESGDNNVPFLNGTWDDQLYGFNAQNNPWCDSWYDHLFVDNFGLEKAEEMTYQYDGCNGAACSESMRYYQENGAFSHVPEVGDQIFFYSSGCVGHTGLVEEINGNTVITIEGNYSDSVCRNSYNMGDSKIAGYGHPKWSAVEDIEITDTSDNVTESSDGISNITIVDAPIDLISIKEEAQSYERTVHVCRAGEQSWFVFSMQYLLKSNAYWVQGDGVFGVDTAQWLIKFQREHPPLEVDCECGYDTWNVLFKNKLLMITDQGYCVKALQYLLRAQNYYIGDGDADGIFGVNVFNQLKRFQRSRGIPDTGKTDDVTWNELIKF